MRSNHQQFFDVRRATRLFGSLAIGAVAAVAGCQHAQRSRPSPPVCAPGPRAAADEQSNLPFSAAAPKEQATQQQPSLTAAPSAPAAATTVSFCRLPATCEPIADIAITGAQPVPGIADPAIDPASFFLAASADPAVTSTTSTALGLADALNTALLQNPDLNTLRGQINVSRAVGGVTRVYPWNPFIQSQYFPNGRPFVPSSTPGGGAGMSNYYVWAMQRFELAHQRRYRAQIAAATVTQVQWNVQQAELLNVAQTMRLYFAALYQRELHELAIETAQLNERLLGVVERRFKANLGMPADLTTAKVAARQARRQADLAEATYQAALLALRQQLNMRLDQPLALGQRLTDFKWEGVRGFDAPEPNGAAASWENLAAELVQGRPDVMAASAGIMVANANAQLARAARVPDISAGPIYETGDDGTRYLGMRLQTDVPVWNTGAPLANQRQAELQQQRLTFGQLRERAILEAQAAIDRYERARRLTEKASADPTLAGGGIPDELRQITSLFEAGQAEVLAVFTTQANLLQDRRTYLDLLNEAAQAAANVVQTTAFPPNCLATVRTEEIPTPVAVAQSQ
jgi:cobalt-zinc-cadmium efflux system outer membrane protein